MGYVLTNYAIQCTDVDSGKTGCFLFDLDHYAATGLFRALSPIFPDLQALYGGTSPDERKPCYVEHKQARPWQDPPDA